MLCPVMPCLDMQGLLCYIHVIVQIFNRVQVTLKSAGSTHFGEILLL